MKKKHIFYICNKKRAVRTGELSGLPANMAKYRVFQILFNGSLIAVAFRSGKGWGAGVVGCCEGRWGRRVSSACEVTPGHPVNLYMERGIQLKNLVLKDSCGWDGGGASNQEASNELAPGVHLSLCAPVPVILSYSCAGWIFMTDADCCALPWLMYETRCAKRRWNCLRRGRAC